MGNKNVEIANFLVIIGFVVFILLFLSSLVFLSRIALSGDSELGEYVSSTQDLLEEADKVQQEVGGDGVENITISKNKIYLEYPETISVEDFSSLSTHLNESFITFKINRSSFVENSTIYFKPIKRSDIFIGDKVLLKNGENARIVNNEETDFTYFVKKKGNVIKGNYSQIKGVVLYED